MRFRTFVFAGIGLLTLSNAAFAQTVAKTAPAPKEAAKPTPKLPDPFKLGYWYPDVQSSDAKKLAAPNFCGNQVIKLDITDHDGVPITDPKKITVTAIHNGHTYPLHPVAKTKATPKDPSVPAHWETDSFDVPVASDPENPDVHRLVFTLTDLVKKGKDGKPLIMSVTKFTSNAGK
jgi:hypothetical protein